MPYFKGRGYGPEKGLLLFIAAWLAYLMLRHGIGAPQ